MRRDAIIRRLRADDSATQSSSLGATSSTGNESLAELQHRIETLEAALDAVKNDFARQHADHNAWLEQVVADQRTNGENIVRMQRQVSRIQKLTTKPVEVARRVKRLPKAPARKLKARQTTREILETAPQITAAELERRREIIADFIAETSVAAPSPVTPAATTEAGPTSFAIDTSTEPLVTVIIPVYNAIDETLGCLRSLAERETGVPFEVLIANDASTDPRIDELRAVGGIRIIDNETNLGFLGNCNNAATHAQGEFLWFLNSDTEITNGALDALVETFETFPNAGIAGSKLLYPDGRLQEAGGIVWRDASAWNLGKGQDPHDPALNYARVADYVSGASMLIGKDLFAELGGFDTAFAPAYYEDTDLCLQVAAIGHDVVYQPGSVVIHHEGSSYDTADNDGEHLVENREVFFKKWSATLADRRANGDHPELEKERKIEHRTLVIDARMLSPDQDSGSLRMTNLLKALAADGHRCTFLPNNLICDEPYATVLRNRGVEVVGRPFVDSVGEFLAMRGAEYDVVILSRLEVAEVHLSGVRRHCPQAHVVFDTVDLHFLRQIRERETTGSVSGGFDPDVTRDAELAAIASADTTIVCSSAEQALLRELMPDSAIEVLSNIHEPAMTITPAKDRHGILFVGGFEHPPNHDAVVWFLDEVFPWILAERPDTTLHIVGSKMTDKTWDLAGPNVAVHGYVEDLEPMYEQSRVAIAPLRYGAGVKGKVTQALSKGVPCVGTSMAVEGTALRHDEHLLVADTPVSFAAHVMSLLTDDDRWDRIAVGGAKAITETFGIAQASERLRTITGR